MRRLKTAALAAMVIVAAAATVYAVAVVEGAAEKEGGVKPIVHKSAYARWRNGPSTDPDFFPIAVWVQSPRNAPRYKAIGINTYVGLWKGPTEGQLAELKKHGMKVICAQNEVGLRSKNDPIIIGWMHGDEPDNMKQEGGKWVPVARPPKTMSDYRKWRKRDPTRPILLNLGQGVANDAYKGNWAERKDYLEFVKAGDIISYDIYPVVHKYPEIKGKLEYVPLGVDRLRKWTNDKKIVWNVVECTGISNPNARPTPYQVKAEIWMSLVHGSRGIIYFCHEFEPNTGGEAALLRNAEMAQGVGVINKQIHELALVLNSPTVSKGATVKSSRKGVPIDIMVKSHGGATYLFAVGMRNAATKGRFQVRGLRGKAVAEVLGEDRKIDVIGGKFTDKFKGYGVHLYKITAGQ